MKKLIFLTLMLVMAVVNCAIVDSNSSTTSSTPSANLNNNNNNNNTSTPCVSNPTHDAALTDSTSSSVSHNWGQDCLSCHKNGGSAQTAWTVAGSVATDNTGVTEASAGSIQSLTMGNLIIDTCGNFYTTNTTSFVGDKPSTSPGTPALTMGALQSGDGSCNKAGCHDGATTLPGEAIIYLQ